MKEFYGLAFAVDPRARVEDLTLARGDSEVNLYCKKVLIQPRANSWTASSSDPPSTV